MVTTRSLARILSICFCLSLILNCTMAWQSSGSSNKELIENLFKNKIIKNRRVLDTMLAVDRGHYISSNPYQDSPQPIGYSVTISAPHMHAHVLDAAADKLQPGCSALDIGSGTGYLTACMAILTGKAIGVEHIKELTEKSIQNVRSDNPHLLETGQLTLITGDGFQGYKLGAPYDYIHVGAAAPSVESIKELINQLKPGGRLIAPVGVHEQSLMQIDKTEDGRVTQRHLMGVMYVPLTTREKQLSEY